MALRSRLSGTVPVSILLHAIAFVAILVVPLAADLAIPDVAPVLPPYVLVKPMPLPPAGAPARPASPSPAPRNSAAPAPVTAPSTIRPEASTAAPGPPVPGAIPQSGAAGFDAIGDSSARVATPLPPPPHPTGPIGVASLPVPPRKIVDVRPMYPEIARAARVQGTVILEAVIDRTGRVSQLRVIKSVPLLDAAATNAVRQWVYTPTTLRGEPVSVLMTVTVTFGLE